MKKRRLLNVELAHGDRGLVGALLDWQPRCGMLLGAQSVAACRPERSAYRMGFSRNARWQVVGSAAAMASGPWNLSGSQPHAISVRQLAAM
jgi:hypothetical protein